MTVSGRRLAFTIALSLAASHPAGAQYFGQNKVQYAAFDFRILETPHFDIYYYPSEHDAVLEAGRLAERWYDRLSRTLHHTFRERQPIVLYASHAHFRQTNVVAGFLSDGVGGVTEHQRGRVVLPFAAGLGETDHVLGHELVHAFQRDILQRASRSSLALLPLWFVEGMAEYLSVGRVDPVTAMWLRDAAADERLPSIDQLDDPKWFPYRYGQALWTYLAARFGDDVVARALTSKATGTASRRLAAATGVEPATLSRDWHRWIHARTLATTPAGAGKDDSRTIVARDKGGGYLNVGPALSPDGREVVFLSERDQYSIDVYLADAASGAIKRKLVSTAGDPHFDSLQFIESAGAWDASGRRFALAAIARGAPVVSVLDVRTGVVEREIRLPQVDQIYSPTWSPDGRMLAFSALKGGLSDLYVLDLETTALDALTDDAYADLQPAWAPDGRSLVFATDRFSTSLARLTFGGYGLATIDVKSRAIRELPAVRGAKNIDPHWSADGGSVFFVADAGEVSNVFRLRLNDGELAQITNVATGVAGVTALSPALAVAARTDRLVFSVYARGAYELRTIDAGAGAPLLASAPMEPRAPALPPPSRAIGPTSSAASVSPLSLADAADFTVKPYRAGLSLDHIAQPYLSAGGGSVGGFLRAGVSFSFGDILGDQQLQTAVQVGRSVIDFAAQASYLNQRSRWNWGLTGGQIPWIAASSRTFRSAGAADGTTIVQQSTMFRQIHRQLAGAALYPFSRADRLELRAGVHTITFDRETLTSRYSGETRQLIDETTESSAAAPGARLLETGVALVRDTSVFGPTSPILGERYRVALAPTFGTIAVTTATVDLRKYVMPTRPFTVAMRLQQTARIGSGSGDPRLLPLVWTLRDLVRGYGDTLATRACVGRRETECASLDTLSVRRYVVGNVEIRFPLLGALRGRADYGSVPLEGFLFADAGAFWSRPPLDGMSTVRTVVRSGGAGVRVNAAGVVFELGAARTLDRAANSWALAFNIRPGF